MAATVLPGAALRRLSEKEWQDQHVIGTRKDPGYLLLAGFDHELIYHTHNSQLSQRGFPDICALRLRDGCLTLAFLELKRWDGKATPEQRTWLSRLTMAAGIVNAMCGGKVRLVVGLYRPQDREQLWRDLQ